MIQNSIDRVLNVRQAFIKIMSEHKETNKLCKFFEKNIKELGNNIKSLYKRLAKIIIVDISLDLDQDKPQLIFESMNSIG